MHGVGTKSVTTINSPPARLLDLTRLVSRVGRGALTGVDRVEMAYLHALSNDAVPLFSLVRLSSGFALLDENGTSGLFSRMVGREPWGKPDAQSLLRLKQIPAQKKAHSDCRRLAIAHSWALKGLAKKIPRSISYLNVGHSNISRDVFEGIKGVGGKVAVMVHDTIPLDYPEYQRAGTVQKFAKKLAVVSEFADMVVYNSDQSRLDGERHFSKFGNVPDCIVAHLGIARTEPDNGPLPPDLDSSAPFFVTVGTIEPRKNHVLLLDLWDDFFSDSGGLQLVILGARGWNSTHIFKRLDAGVSNVFEVNSVSDRMVAQLMAKSAGLLFPSIAEGFGLPPAEAILQQTPVICGDLPVYREFLGNIPVYADVKDRYLWKATIEKFADQKRSGRAREFDLKKLPTWEAHFNKVLKVA